MQFFYSSAQKGIDTGERGGNEVASLGVPEGKIQVGVR